MKKVVLIMSLVFSVNALAQQNGSTEITEIHDRPTAIMSENQKDAETLFNTLSVEEKEVSGGITYKQFKTADDRVEIYCQKIKRPEGIAHYDCSITFTKK